MRLILWAIGLSYCLGGFAFSSIVEAVNDERINPPNISIVGGTPAAQGEFPYLALLLSGGFFCHGNLIASSYVLTTGVCLTILNLGNIGNASVHLNTLSMTGGGNGSIARKVSSYIIHENYNAAASTNNIAIIVLDQPVTGIPVIALPTSYLTTLSTKSTTEPTTELTTESTIAMTTETTTATYPTTTETTDPTTTTGRTTTDTTTTDPTTMNPTTTTGPTTTEPTTMNPTTTTGPTTTTRKPTTTTNSTRSTKPSTTTKPTTTSRPTTTTKSTTSKLKTTTKPTKTTTPTTTLKPTTTSKLKTTTKPTKTTTPTPTTKPTTTSKPTTTTKLTTTSKLTTTKPTTIKQTTTIQTTTRKPTTTKPTTRFCSTNQPRWPIVPRCTTKPSAKQTTKPTSAGQISSKRPIKRATFRDLSSYDNKTGVIAGWGPTTVDAGGTSPILLKGAETILSNEACTQEMGSSYKATVMLCAKPINSGFCYNEGGVPLVVDGVLVGIASWLKQSRCGLIDGFTRVSTYTSWISDTITKNPPPIMGRGMEVYS